MLCGIRQLNFGSQMQTCASFLGISSKRETFDSICESCPEYPKTEFVYSLVLKLDFTKCRSKLSQMGCEKRTSRCENIGHGAGNFSVVLTSPPRSPLPGPSEIWAPMLKANDLQMTKNQKKLVIQMTCKNRKTNGCKIIISSHPTTLPSFPPSRVQARACHPHPLG